MCCGVGVGRWLRRSQGCCEVFSLADWAGDAVVKPGQDYRSGGQASLEGRGETLGWS